MATPTPEPELQLCGEPTPIGNTRDCPREKGHDGPHYAWAEGHKHGNDYGITVMTFGGEKVLHFSMTGKTTAEELCVLIAYFEWIAERKRGIEAEADG
jgi:hypothetical protein